MDITKEQFEKMFFSMTNKEMSKKLNISTVTLNKHARKLGLRKRKSFNNKPKLKIIKNQGN